MSRRRVPTYRCYKPKNLGLVVLDGKQHYLGAYGTPESIAEYNRLVQEWLARNEVCWFSVKWRNRGWKLRWRTFGHQVRFADLGRNSKPEEEAAFGRPDLGSVRMLARAFARPVEGAIPS